MTDIVTDKYTLHLGDCLEYMKSMPDKSVDAIVTDPPYKISQTYSANVDADNLAAVSSIFPAMHDLLRIVKPGGYLAMFYDTRILPLAFESAKWSGWKYLRGLTFYRRWGVCNKLYGWMSSSDFILIFRAPGGGNYEFYSDDWRHDVYIRDKPDETYAGHPAQKPEWVLDHIVKHLAPESGTVFDPYTGSGTTAIACGHSGRKFIGCEIDEKYFAVAEKRIREAAMQEVMFK